MSQNAESDFPTPSRIIVRGVNWLGDAIMTTPAMLRLREKFPQAHIALLTHEKLTSLWTGHSAVDSLVKFADGEGVWKVAQQLRELKFDLGIVLPNSPRSAMELWLAAVPTRVGYGRSVLLNKSVAPRAVMMQMRKKSPAEIQRLINANTQQFEFGSVNTDHHMHHYLHLMKALGCNPAPLPPSISVSDEELKATADKFDLTTMLNNGRPVCGLNAGAEYGPAKRWPRERFLAAAIELRKRTNCAWIVFGGKSDLEIATGLTLDIETACGNENESGSTVVNLAGKTSLRELCAAMKLCRLVLTNDTGPMHVAAAVGTPVVVPFGSTSPELTGPGMPGDARHQLLKSNAACSPCFLRECPIDFRCMSSITVERVVNAALQILQR